MPHILPRAHNLMYILYMMVSYTSLLEHIAVLESSIGISGTVHKEAYPTEGIKYERATQ